MSIAKIAKFHFSLSQNNFIWFPFLFLKPSNQQSISHARVLLMSLCFGAYFYLMQIVWIIILDDIHKWQFSLNEILSYIIFFFFWFESVTRPLWNYSISHQE